MKTRVLIDILAILVLYGVYAAIIYLIPWTMLGDSPRLLRAALTYYFQHYSLDVLVVSLVCMLTWYALGEWGIKPYAASGTWYLVWFLLLVVILGAATAVVLINPINTIVAVYYFLGGVLFFYIGSVFFSPLNAKFVIWPARHLRG